MQCTGTQCIMKSALSYFRVNELGAHLFFVDSNGNAMEQQSSVQFGFSHLVERDKVVIGTDSHCWSPQDDPVSIDPSYSPLIRSYAMADLQATLEDLPDYPTTGVHSVRYSYHQAGRLLLAVTYGLTNSDFDIILSNDTSHTQGYPITSQYRYAEAINLSLQLPLSESCYIALKHGILNSSHYLQHLCKNTLI